MTIFMSVIGLIVFVVSLFTRNFGTAFKRMSMFVVVGIVCDSLAIVALNVYVYNVMH